MWQWRSLRLSLALLAGLSLGRGANAQVDISNSVKYNSGQDVQPIFEGWRKNADGSFAMHFGYLNRNYIEQLVIPIGPDNNIEPDGPDRGQPTHFYPRVNRNLFVVTVPSNFGKREVIWTLTAHGKTLRAYGWLQPEWEIGPEGSAQGGGQQNQDPELVKNQPPSMVVDTAFVSKLSTPFTLSVKVTDDGLPKPTKPTPSDTAGVGGDMPAILQGGVAAPVNVPQIAGVQTDLTRRSSRRRELSATFTAWRAPASVILEPRTATVRDGKAETTTLFTKPGEYVIRVKVSDGLLVTEQDVRVTVKPY